MNTHTHTRITAGGTFKEVKEALEALAARRLAGGRLGLLPGSRQSVASVLPSSRTQWSAFYFCSSNDGDEKDIFSVW